MNMVHVSIYLGLLIFAEFFEFLVYRAYPYYVCSLRLLLSFVRINQSNF